MSGGARDYVAVRVGRTPQGRRNWRLYSCKRRSSAPACPLGDFDRLRKIRRSLERPGRRVTARRIVRDQVTFRVEAGS